MLFAGQVPEKADGAQPVPQPTGGGELLSMLPMMLIIGVMFYFLIIRPQRVEQSKRDERLKALKKNDKVVTIGGIIGVISNIEPDGREITLLVNDTTRIRFLRTAVQTVLSEEKATDETAAK